MVGVGLADGVLVQEAGDPTHRVSRDVIRAHVFPTFVFGSFVGQAASFDHREAAKRAVCPAPTSNNNLQGGGHERAKRTR
jgi:hypothetical protein